MKKRVLAAAMAGVVMALVLGPRAAAPPAPDDANRLCLTTAEFTDANAMTLEDIREFLKSRTSFLVDRITDVDGVEIDPAEVLATAARTSTINPRVLLTTLQKEQRAITRSTPPPVNRQKVIMGYGRPTTIRAQISDAAAQFRRNLDRLSADPPQPASGGWQVGVASNTLDPLTVTPASSAVATLYSYTPWAGEDYNGRQEIGGNGLFCQVWEVFGFLRQGPATTTVAGRVVRQSGEAIPTWILPRTVTIRNTATGATIATGWFEPDGSFMIPNVPVAGVASLAADGVLGVGIKGRSAATAPVAGTTNVGEIILHVGQVDYPLDPCGAQRLTVALYGCGDVCQPYCQWGSGCSPCNWLSFATYEASPVSGSSDFDPGTPLGTQIGQLRVTTTGQSTTQMVDNNTGECCGGDCRATCDLRFNIDTVVPISVVAY